MNLMATPSNTLLEKNENSNVSILISFSPLEKDDLAALTMILRLGKQHADFVEVMHHDVEGVAHAACD